MMSPMTCLALHILVVLVNISGALRNLHFIRLSFTSERHHSKTSLRERTLLIDNYDSYTYNLFQLIASISGVEPYVVYNNALGGCWQDVVNHALPFDNIVISPGPGHPSNPVDFGICKDAIQYAHVPILGVCLGYQGLVTTNGGKVLKAPTPMHGRLSTIYHTSKGIFAGVQNASRAVRYHSLVAESVLPEELEVTAWTLDGLGMGLQHKTKPHYGVQFHPESIKTPIGRKIMENFISISRQHRKHIPRKSPFPTNAHPLTISSNISSQSSITSSSTNTTKKVFVYSLNASAYSVPMIDVFEHLYGNVSTSFLLDSECAGPGASFPTPYPQRSGMSIMGAASSKGSYVLEYDHNRELTIQWYNEHTGELDSGVAVNANLLSYIRQQVSKQHSVECFLNGRLFSDDILPQLNGLLHGGMFGYLSYELGLELEDMLSASTTKFSRTSQEGKKAINKDLPLGFFIVPRSFLAYDHSTKMYYTIGMEGGDNGDSNDSTTNDGRQDAERLLDMVDKIVKSNDRVSLHDSEESRSSKGMLVAWKSKDAYKADIEECLRQISNGDTYEVCLTVQFQGKQNKPALQASTQCPALSTYRRLRLFNSAPYASFIKHNFRSNSPSGFGFAICCSSPERYLKIEEDGTVSSKPIKGTARRDLSNLTNDQSIAEKLYLDEKSQAENLMITDLVRNDLGRVCDIGSVQVPSLMNIESYTTVHQMVSTISGKLRSDRDVVDAIVATFPGGSMTGAPKLRTMQIIRSLELRPRGVYAGSIGYISMKGTMDMNIVIRTAVLQGRNITIGAGGAIVALSDPNEEIEEVLLKARAVSKALGYDVAFPSDT